MQDVQNNTNIHVFVHSVVRFWGISKIMHLSTE
jgi:hypothetical protein